MRRKENGSMLKDVKIGKRLALGFGLVLVLMGGVSAAAYWGIETTEGLAREVLTVESPLVEHSQMARAHTLALRRFEKDYFLNIGSPDEEAAYLAKWKEQREALDQQLGELEKLTREPADLESIRAMRKDAAAYDEGFHKALGVIRDRVATTPQEANAAVAPVKDEIRRLEATATEFAAGRSKALESLHSVVTDSVRRTLSLMLAVMALALVFTAAAGTLITRSITAPLAVAVQVAERVAEGDLEVRIEVGGRDETGQLLSSMQAMVASLRKMVEAAAAIAGGDLTVKVAPQSDRDALGNALTEMTERLTQAMSEIRSGAAGLSSASAQVSSTSQSLSQGTSEQAASVEETTSSLEQMSASIGQNADNSPRRSSWR
jgi:methyl-accepting chemotaxis protein